MQCSDPEALVTSWLAAPSRQPEHPFVVEVGELAILAYGHCLGSRGRRNTASLDGE